MAGRFGKVAVVFLTFACGVQSSERVSGDSHAGIRQWQPTELVFTSDADYPDPFDFRTIGFTATFRGPNGERIRIPGFWDGDRVWKIRFTPTSFGVWTYATSCEKQDDTGLHGRRGKLNVNPPASDNLLHRHGGFLKVSPDSRYLTYTDGTAFFWLGDTWWRCPSAGVPFSNFQRMVDFRSKQGFTVFQAHGFRSIFPDKEEHGLFASSSGVDAFHAVKQSGRTAIGYWREIDKYMAYADEKGMVGVMGFAGHALLDPISLDDLKRLWHYYVARYGAYPITFLITQEYNAEIGDAERRVQKLLALGQFIKDTDPYRRAMTVHPWVLGRDKRQAWSEPWFDFIMLQAGHRQFAAPHHYHRIYFGSVLKPLLESEANYEGFRKGNFYADAACIRRTAYTAIQSGSFGFTYGAQGLYAGVLDAKVPGPTARWGPVLTWEAGLELPGGAQLEHLRSCYESVCWYRLVPRPNAIVPRGDVLVKADGDHTFLLYYVDQGAVSDEAELQGASPGGEYLAMWFDPRTGMRRVMQEILTAGAKGLLLPKRPDERDWMLILERR